MVESKSMTAQEIVCQDLAELYIGNLNTVDADLKLPVCGRNGSRFTWESRQILFISHEGKVTRPTHGVGNRKVILDVTAEYEEWKECRSFEATVLEEPGDIIVKEIKIVNAAAQTGQSAELPPVVIAWDADGAAVTLPVVWEEYKPLLAAGTLEISGTAEGTELRAKAEIRYEAAEYKSETAEYKSGTPEKMSETESERHNSRTPVDNVFSFAYGRVKLKSGSRFAKAQERMIQFLKAADADQFLYNFRSAAGLDTKGALPMTGWDAPECNLKGHTTGHYLSGIALAYSVSQDQGLKEKIDYLVEALGECQAALEQKGWHKGFLSAYGEEQFDLLEQYTRYPEIWAPYYTLDKIMCGLYDCYSLAGNQQALSILCKMGDWVYNRLSVLPKEQRDRMWSMYIAGEFGGMIGILVKLYRASGEERYCEAARFFWNEKLFYPMAENVDTLGDMHANQHIPQIIGVLELYKAKGEERNARIAEHFWNFVSEAHSYVIGGTGENEMFHQAGHLTDFLSDKTAESCASYNMMRLTSGLFRLKPEASRMDYYEHVLRNHLIATMSHTCDGGTTYFMSVRPGGQKEFGTDENTCCHGTGMESRFRYMEDIYMKKETTVYVNLYIPSELTEENICIEQTKTDSAAGFETVQFRIEAADTEIAFRVPGWAKDCNVKVNGTIYNQAEDGYIYIRRNWSRKDKVEITLGYELRVIPSPDNLELVSLMYGPYILAEVAEEETFRSLPDPTKSEIRHEGDAIAIVIGERTFIPLADIDQQKYHVYLKR